MSSTAPAPAPPSPHKSRAKRILVTLLKVVIAVAGICFVALKFSLAHPTTGEPHVHILGLFYAKSAFHWSDTVVLPQGQELRAVTFQEDVFARVVSRSPVDPSHAQIQLVRIEFPPDPVSVQVDGRTVSVVIAEDTPIPGANSRLGIPHELELPIDRFAEINSERIQEGLRSLFGEASSKWHLILAAWALLSVPFLVTAIRWRNLMLPQGINVPLSKCIQLTFVGQFYSIMLPGITGGDLVKIMYAARLTGSKTKSFITIILDRVIGLVALMVIAAAAAGVQLLLNHHRGTTDDTLLSVFLMITAMLLGLAAGTTIYFSRRLRKLIGIEWFIENFSNVAASNAGTQTEEHEKIEHLFRVINGLMLAAAILGISLLAVLRWGAVMAWAQNNTIIIYSGIGLLAALGLVAVAGLVFHGSLINRMTPLLRKVVEAIVRIDETLRVYRGHFSLLAWAFLISLISQLTLPLSAWLSGRAFGMNAPLTYYLAYVPLAVLASSLPVSPPQGFGVMDWILYHFFVERGTARAGQAVALAQAIRFLPIIWNLIGAYWVLTGSYSRHKMHEEEVAIDAAEHAHPSEFNPT